MNSILVAIKIHIHTYRFTNTDHSCHCRGGRIYFHTDGKIIGGSRVITNSALVFLPTNANILILVGQMGAAFKVERLYNSHRVSVIVLQTAVRSQIKRVANVLRDFNCPFAGASSVYTCGADMERQYITFVTCVQIHC